MRTNHFRRLIDGVLKGGAFALVILSASASILAFIVFYTGYQSYREMESALSINRNSPESKNNILPLSRMVPSSRLVDLYSVEVDREHTKGYAFSRSSFFHPPQLVSTFCNAAGRCAIQSILNVPKSIGYIDSLFVDDKSGDLVAFNRDGDGLFIDRSEQLHKPFHIEMSCHLASGFKGWGTPDGGTYAIRAGAFQDGYLAAEINAEYCLGQATLTNASDEPVMIGPLGPYDKDSGGFAEQSIIHLELKFGAGGKISGRVFPIRLSGQASIHDFSYRSLRGQDMSRQQAQWDWSGRAERLEIWQRQREKFEPIFFQHKSGLGLLSYDQIPINTRLWIMSFTGYEYQKLVAVFGDLRYWDNGTVIITTEGVYQLTFPRKYDTIGASVTGVTFEELYRIKNGQSVSSNAVQRYNRLVRSLPINSKFSEFEALMADLNGANGPVI